MKKQTKMEDEIIAYEEDQIRPFAYVSGKITGLDDKEVKDTFSLACARLNRLGFQAVNPLNDGLDWDASWADHIIEDLKLLKDCSVLYCTCRPGDSIGADIELAVARKIGIPVIFRWRPDEYIADLLDKLTPDKEKEERK